MFTGIVEEIGSVEALNGSRVRIAASVVLEDAHLGDSIAVNGCCLTVVEQGPGWWEADVSDETFARTSLHGIAVGSPLNLERSVRLADRLGGHLVQGHEKGSITVDGVSLTVVAPTIDTFTVAIIPHTASVTTLGTKQPGDHVNIEVDVLAKYVERLLAGHVAAEGAPS